MEAPSLHVAPAAAPGDAAGGREVQVRGLPALRRVRVVECVQRELSTLKTVRERLSRQRAWSESRLCRFRVPCRLSDLHTARTERERGCVRERVW